VWLRVTGAPEHQAAFGIDRDPNGLPNLRLHR
jgi:hypothetical protein